MPSPLERAAFAGIPEDATLETLAPALAAAAAQSAPQTRGVNWATLDEDEQRELELLVERVVGLGYFAKRRGAQASVRPKTTRVPP